MNYQEFKNLLTKRASHRKFLDEPVPENDIRSLVECARLAPSGHNLQPWKFIAVSNKNIINKIHEAIASNLELLYKTLPGDFVEKHKKYSFFLTHFKEAPLVIAVLTKKDEYISTEIETKYNAKLPKTEHFDFEILSIGAAVENLIMAAVSLGYGTCWMTEPVIYAQKAIEDVLGVKEPYHFVTLLAIGKPVKEREMAPKKTTDELLTIID